MAIVTLSVDADGVALISLDDPSRSANVTSPKLTAELLAAIDRVASEGAIRGAVIASGKPGRFVAGGDINDFVGAWERRMSEAEAFGISDRWNRDSGSATAGTGSCAASSAAASPSRRPSTARRSGEVSSWR
jgi:enoyl-CoA hydratase/carnithine racemase